MLNMEKKFKLSHLFMGITGLLLIQAVLLKFLPVVAASEGFIILFGIIGAAMNIYVAIEAIKEVKGHLHMIMFLWLIVLEFIVFFSFEYWFLLLVQPASFPSLNPDVLSVLLHSTMVFVFNPIYLPVTLAGRALLLINTLSALGLVLFILQNIWQLRTNISEPSGRE
jgi:hypothetical protein